MWLCGLKGRLSCRLALRMGGGLGKLGKHSTLLGLKCSCGSGLLGACASQGATIPATEEAANRTQTVTLCTGNLQEQAEGMTRARKARCQ